MTKPKMAVAKNETPVQQPPIQVITMEQAVLRSINDVQMRLKVIEAKLDLLLAAKEVPDGVPNI